ncbi:MAG: glycosyltransferase [Candidatus Omnitrophica bacterium]|nr:glycosyltransferase [Candidatus Omnitrophota bacterium]
MSESRITMENPRISVVLSVFNGIPHLRESIESILDQTFDDIELILIDDGSTDDTPRIVESFTDKRIRKIRHEKNIGLTKSLNEGLRLARGKYMARQDSDDISLPERLSKQYAFMEKHPDIVLTGCGAEIIDNEGKKVSSFVPVTDPTVLARTSSEKCQIFHPSIIFRNDCGIYYREKFIYSQDYDLYLRLLTQGKKIANMPDILIRYRLSPGAISYSKRTHQFLFSRKAREFYEQRIRTGKDFYEDFNTDSVISINADNTEDSEILLNELKASVEIEDLQRIRSFYVKYLLARKRLDRYLVYFLISFLPAKFLRLVKKLNSKKRAGKLNE